MIGDGSPFLPAITWPGNLKPQLEGEFLPAFGA
jgi:hypothetical protein